MAGKETVTSTPGPMTVDREALEIFMKAALAKKPWRVDPNLTAKEWTPYKFDKPLKVAIQWSDGIVTPHPPMQRALREVADACRKAGMEVVEWDCTDLDHQKAWDIVSALYWPDGAEQVLRLLNETGEPVLPLTKFIIHEQPTVRKMDMEELWKVSFKEVNERQQADNFT
jgi:Asp-tRNA(Asn)/Glu-tRNA(Gln) amidotransferase A subunit family amidase